MTNKNQRADVLETENHAAQLSSLLMLLHGNGQESFNALSERDRDNILWLASDLACKIDVAVNGEVAK
ncbi:hypothetical protein [Bordetella genomosp. 4]|uniref:hypothetical protein n=1 Tax=Bordetella genomosp. 4 TaxID=463044 RepID=UPI000B9E8DB9|nr:hypothetical protein [Bordetella genomosp. 4]OZI43187.1 hypothetical protein CAL21_20565 [Bordetella genomosp. 4]